MIYSRIKIDGIYLWQKRKKTILEIKANENIIVMQFQNDKNNRNDLCHFGFEIVLREIKQDDAIKVLQSINMFDYSAWAAICCLLPEICF